MKVALFKDIAARYPYETVVRDTTVGPDGKFLDGYVRTSDWTEVDFKPLAIEAVVESQLKELDNVEAELRNKFQERLDQIDGERQKLRSLTHEVAS